MADPTALQTAVAAMHAVAQIGMPEARLILAQAVVHNCLAPKSDATYAAMNAAIADVRAGKIGVVPTHLRGTGYAGAKALGHGEGYRYTHDEPNAVGPQQFLPDVLVGRRTTTTPVIAGGNRPSEVDGRACAKRFVAEPSEVGHLVTIG